MGRREYSALPISGFNIICSDNPRSRSKGKRNRPAGAGRGVRAVRLKTSLRSGAWRRSLARSFASARRALGGSAPPRRTKKTFRSASYVYSFCRSVGYNSGRPSRPLPRRHCLPPASPRAAARDVSCLNSTVCVLWFVRALLTRTSTPASTQLNSTFTPPQLGFLIESHRLLDTAALLRAQSPVLIKDEPNHANFGWNGRKVRKCRNDT